MPRELSLDGIFYPGLLWIFLACLLVLWGIDTVAGRLGLYRYVWHPALFRLALFVCMFGAAGLLFL